MGCKEGMKLPEIPWAQDNYKLIWDFITELEEDVNYKVLFGKKDPSEVNYIHAFAGTANCVYNTSGDSCISVFKCIGEQILLDLFSLDPGTVEII